MGDINIKDGTGTSSIAMVTSDNEILTRATVSTAFQKASLQGNAFSISTPIYTLPTLTSSPAAVDAKILYFKNNTQLPMVLNSNTYIWNGGSTNWDRPLRGSFYLEAGTVSGNNIPSGALSINRTFANKTLDIEVQLWDGASGTGLTFNSGSSIGAETFVPQGIQKIEGGDAFILGPGDAISIAMRGIEVGDGGASMLGYLLTEDLY